MAELLELVLTFYYHLPQPFCALCPLLTSPLSFAFLPLVRVLLLGGFLRNSCCLPDGKYGLMLVFLGMFLHWHRHWGTASARLCALFALSLLPLCCPHPSSLILGLISMPAPPCFPGPHFWPSPAIPFYEMILKNVYILNMLSRMKALCLKPNISNIIF